MQQCTRGNEDGHDPRMRLWLRLLILLLDSDAVFVQQLEVREAK